MPFLLDTDTCIFALKHHTRVRQMMTNHRRSEINISVITECELLLGAAKSANPRSTKKRVLNFLQPLRILEFNSEDAIHYAAVRATLEKAGTPIGPLDTLIGSQAVSRRLTLVTHNTREFTRIPKLKVIDWHT